MQELVSIIIPIYNVEDYLERCLNSVVNQTYKNLEIILVNDGSTDRCKKICDDYQKKDDRIKVIHKENGGLSDARNAGIEIAKGEYISFIDSDDYVSNDYIEYMYNMIKNTSSKLAICGVKEVWAHTTIVEEAHTKSESLTAKQTLRNLLLDQGIEICAYAKLYHRDLFKEIRFPKGKVYEDSAVMYKLIMLADKIVYGDKKCYYYIARNGSISKHKDFNLNENDYIKHTNEMLEFLLKKFPDLEVPIHRFDINSKFRILKMLMFTKPRNVKMEKEYIKYIKKYQKEVLKFSETPKKDKIAIILINIGRPVFKISWFIYRKVTGRI